MFFVLFVELHVYAKRGNRAGTYYSTLLLAESLTHVCMHLDNHIAPFKSLSSFGCQSSVGKCGVGTIGRPGVAWEDSEGRGGGQWGNWRGRFQLRNCRSCVGKRDSTDDDDDDDDVKRFPKNIANRSLETNIGQSWLQTPDTNVSRTLIMCTNVCRMIIVHWMCGYVG